MTGKNRVSPLTEPEAARLPAFSTYSEIVRILQMSDDKSQLDKFKEAARELETDDDPERFKEKLARIARHKPVPEKPD
jgi:hypothetical protein